MITLTPTETVVLETVRTLHRGRAGETVGAGQIRDRAWETGQIHYEAVHQALNALVALGLVVKPKRGRYAPADTTPSGNFQSSEEAS